MEFWRLVNDGAGGEAYGSFMVKIGGNNMVFLESFLAATELLPGRKCRRLSFS